MIYIKINLKAVRANAGYTQKQWAKILEVSNITVNNWEHGKTIPDFNKIKKMSELSGIPIEFIFIKSDTF